ncbi:hypothetical protein Xcel_3121 [Xylanimonas cellulosilytica DSM 15894]|uniref:DUF559 domain-containing protein n=1 Tax=Xylanimonas cellulosilytica (strain DSM 15894 / JCM 12276 / CECT 5975 / KCTC 9989 / LMG 20990 / NBRC 107835 / XIL07) TaxID=446471 RepID=D1BZZ4_XYLCX|nr:type IV toxin-antitoxin system AbiEi family antitoxin domain-containing protein [Xylanimonas cellulosilytica]ACZ32122.1 hypothetical protein Xcel_3121 [Xylanimonas cellulosilytica DSM 15894]
MPPDLLALAARQEGLLAFAQFTEHGVDGARVARLVAQSRLLKVARGVYDTVLVPPRERGGPDAFDHRRRRSALTPLLALGPKAFAVGMCALALHGVEGLPAEIPPEAAVSDAGPRRLGPGIVVRRYRDCSTVVVGGWRAACVADALVQSVSDLGRRRALAVLDSALHRGLIDAAGVAAAHERARGRRGVERTHDVWALADSRAESTLESAGRLSCIDVGVPPDVLQLEVVDAAGRFVARCDLAWWLGADRWLVAEIDGADPHSRPEALLHDRTRQNALVTGGIQLVRVTAADVWRGALPRLVEPILRRAVWEPGRLAPDQAVLRFPSD